MPSYGFDCQGCKARFDIFTVPSKYIDKQPCPECGSADTKRYYTVPYVTFKGDGWVDKDLRIKRQMQEKNRLLDKKQKDRYRTKGRAGAVAALTPNVGGEEVDTWAEATKLAASKGKNTTGYAKQAAAEKAGT